MLVLKIYLVGLSLFILYCSMQYIKENSTSWFEFLLVLLLNIWLFPISLYVKVRKKILEKVLDRKIKNDLAKLGLEKTTTSFFLKYYGVKINNKDNLYKPKNTWTILLKRIETKGEDNAEIGN